MTPEQSNVLFGALGLGAQGLPCFPCVRSSDPKRDKRPTLKGGFYNAATDPVELRAIWQRGPGDLIAVPTGSRTMFDVLDIDLAKHADAKQWWEESKDSIPETRIHQTQSGGLHVFFQHRTGLKNRAKAIVQGVDVRTSGGYIIWWPSCGGKLISAPDIATWPEWLFKQLVRTEPKPPPRPHLRSSANDGTSRRYALGALRRAFERVAGTSEGVRNHTLNTETYSLSRFIPHALGAEEIAQAMHAAARHAGLSESEIIATIRSALGARRAA